MPEKILRGKTIAFFARLCYIVFDNSAVADEYGRVYACAFTAVSAVKDFNSVIGGSTLSKDFDKTVIELGDLANGFYSEYVKDITA